jgi:hypothetical protein
MKKFCRRSIVMHVAVTLVAIIMSSWSLANMLWDDETIMLEMWSSIVILFTSSFVEVIDITGFIAVTLDNGSLLVIYITSMMLFFMLLFCMALVTFLNAFHVGIAYIPTNIATGVLSRLWRYNIVLGVCCSLILIVGFIPLFVSYRYNLRLQRERSFEQETRALQIGSARDLHAVTSKLLLSNSTQIRVTLKIMSLISLIAAIVMLAYGTYALHFLQHVNFVATTFEIFGLIYGGVLTILVSLAGFWAASTSRKGVVLFYERLAIPALLVVDIDLLNV